MKNFLLTIEYDGSDFCGWQRQKNDPTIQETIEKAIATMTGPPVSLAGSGRTDAGVHALGQTASFQCDTRLTADIFFKGINSLLPDSIVIRDCREVPPDFHARFSARGKTYRYHIRNHPTAAAIGRRYFWHIRRQLDLAAMQHAAGLLTGTHDFKAFEAAGSPRVHTVRTVLRAGFTRDNEEMVLFEIRADGFLRYMVRNIVGTLVDVGLAKRPPEDVERVLESRDRSQAAATAPPNGLFLVAVEYGDTEKRK